MSAIVRRMRAGGQGSGGAGHRPTSPRRQARPWAGRVIETLPMTESCCSSPSALVAQPWGASDIARANIEAEAPRKTSAGRSASAAARPPQDAPRHELPAPKERTASSGRSASPRESSTHQSRNPLEDEESGWGSLGRAMQPNLSGVRVAESSVQAIAANTAGSIGATTRHPLKGASPSFGGDPAGQRAIVEPAWSIGSTGGASALVRVRSEAASAETRVEAPHGTTKAGGLDELKEGGRGVRGEAVREERCPRPHAASAHGEGVRSGDAVSAPPVTSEASPRRDGGASHGFHEEIPVN